MNCRLYYNDWNINDSGLFGGWDRGRGSGRDRSGFGLVDDLEGIGQMLDALAPDEGGVSEVVDLHSLNGKGSTLFFELVSSLKSLVESSTSANLSYLPT
jgi:hypothetical protein